MHVAFLIPTVDRIGALIYERRTDVLTVPSAAVTTGDDGTSTVLLVDADGNQVETVVEVGESVGSLTEILSEARTCATP